MNCEHCEGLLKENSGCLTAVEFWKYPVGSKGKRYPTYLWVCDHCLETRHEWCSHLFPEKCDTCGGAIEPGEHIMENQLNRDGKPIAIDGLYPDETCNIICESCYLKNGTT